MEEEEHNGGAPASSEDHDRELSDVRKKNAEREKFHENLAEGQWRTLADLLANPPPPPGDGTQNNGSVLMAEVGGTPSPPPPSQSALTKDVVTRFVRVHGSTVGSGPFLRGFRVLLETQRGKTTTVAWRLKSAVLTQSGGEEWMRDAVSLLCTSCHRRIDCEGEGIGGGGGGKGSAAKKVGGENEENKNTDEKGGEPAALGEWLAWSLPVTLSDGDITKILDILPTHVALEDNGNPTGVVLLDAHRKEDQPRDAYWYGSTAGRRGSSGRRRESCFCFLPVPLFFVVATLCCVVVMVR